MITHYTTLIVEPEDLVAAEVRIHSDKPITAIRIGDLTIQASGHAPHEMAAALRNLADRMADAVVGWEIKQDVLAEQVSA